MSQNLRFPTFLNAPVSTVFFLLSSPYDVIQSRFSIYGHLRAAPSSWQQLRSVCPLSPGRHGSLLKLFNMCFFGCEGKSAKQDWICFFFCFFSGQQPGKHASGTCPIRRQWAHRASIRCKATIQESHNYNKG